MHHRPRRRAAVGRCSLVLALAGAACGRATTTTETRRRRPRRRGRRTGTTTAAAPRSRASTPAASATSRTCARTATPAAPPTSASPTTRSSVGTITDKGFASRPGLNEEMYDAAVAFAAWCNEHGGINGRELVVADRDAALIDYNDRIIESCDEDFALVGGGAVLDDADNGGRVACGLPNIAGYVVSPDGPAGRPPGAAGAEPARRAVAAGAYRRHRRAVPRADRPLRDHDRRRSARCSTPVTRHSASPAELGLHRSSTARSTTPAASRTGGRSSRACATPTSQVFEFIGEPTFFSPAARGDGRRSATAPRSSSMQTNFYDPLYARDGRRHRREHVHPHAVHAVRAGRREPGDGRLPRADGALQPRRQDRPARDAGDLGVPAVRPGGHGVRLRAHPGVPAREGRLGRPSGPAAGCTRRRNPARSTAVAVLRASST